MNTAPTPITDQEVEDNRHELPKYGWVSPATARGMEQQLAYAQLRLSVLHMLFATAENLSHEQWVIVRDKLKRWAEEAKAETP